MGVLIMEIIIFQRPFPPGTEMIVEVGSCSDSAFFPIIHMHRAIQMFFEEPGVAAQQERPKAAAVTGNEIKIVDSSTQVPRVERIIKDRQVTQIKDGMTCLDPVARDDLQVLGSYFDRRFSNVIAGDISIRCKHDLVRRLEMEPLSKSEKRRLASAELFRLDLASV